MKFAPILQITRYTIIFCVKRMLKYIGFFPLYAALWTIINSENIEFAMVMPDTIKLKTKNQMTTNHVVKCELGVRELGKFKIKNCVCTSVHAQSCLTLCYPWTAAHQAPLSVEYSGKNITGLTGSRKSRENNEKGFTSFVRNRLVLHSCRHHVDLFM